MTDKSAGLIDKYHVERTDGKPVIWAFVLEDTDPLAIPALLTYADMAEGAGYLDLASDLRERATHLPRRRGEDERAIRQCIDEGWQR